MENSEKQQNFTFTYLSLREMDSIALKWLVYFIASKNNNLFVMHLKIHGIEKPPHFSQKDFSTLKNKVHSPQK